MPITINEVEIVTNVNESTSASSSSSSSQQGGAMSSVDKELLIQECLNRVRELLEDLKER